ncbi:MAG: SAM-dependent methyltransferase [bacterium]
MSTSGPFLQALQSELGGSIPFERFMREALYNPTFGYYSARIQTVGLRGDFSTMATLDRSLAAGIARWIQKKSSRNVIEIGAGSGQLARDILRSLGWWKRQSLRYHIVEISAPLREAQRKILKGLGVRWHDTLSSALEAARGEACIFSNELVDAFPCRVFDLTPEGWHEVHIRIAEGRVHELLKPSSLPDSSVFEHEYKQGQRVEVHESYCQWLQDWAPGWKSGAMLTIDYGDTLPALYHRRPAGSLRGYAAHQRLTGAEIYQAPGRCDLTADVNFSDLQRWGWRLGWRVLSHSHLSYFLTPDLPRAFQAAAQAFRVMELAPA